MVPPTNDHVAPLAPIASASVVAIVSLPVRLTAPPVVESVPREAKVSVPPRLSVLPALTLIVPLLLQLLEAIVRVPPLSAPAVPLLVKFVVLIVSVRLAVSALIVPLLSSVSHRALAHACAGHALAAAEVASREVPEKKGAPVSAGAKRRISHAPDTGSRPQAQ